MDIPNPRESAQPRQSTRTLIQISYKEIYDKFLAPDSPLTDAQKETEWRKFKGLFVEWEGIVTEVKTGWLGGVTVFIKMGIGSFTGMDVRLSIAPKSKDFAIKLRKGQIVKFRGATSSQPELLSPMNLEDVTIDIDNVTQSGQQTPWTSSSLQGEFYFNPSYEASMPLTEPQRSTLSTGSEPSPELERERIGREKQETQRERETVASLPAQRPTAAPTDPDDAIAQYNRGNKYREGQGVTKDYGEAVKWYRKAADQGNAAAQRNLGIMYITGLGVARDYRESVKWYQKAADQGDEVAKEQLWNLRRRE